MADENSNSHLTNTKQNIQVHNRINNTSRLEEELEWWQEKVLELKLKKVKDDLEHNKNKSKVEKEIEEEKQKNKILKEEMDELEEKKKKFREESMGQINKLSEIREKIKHYESVNTEMYTEFIHKTNFIKQLENPENLLMHLMQFDRETLKNLCIKLNTLQQEKFMHYMMQQQYFSQMYFNQQHKGVYPPPYNVYNYNMGGNVYPNNFDGVEEEFPDNAN